jgi:predicted dehydrogenase
MQEIGIALIGVGEAFSGHEKGYATDPRIRIAAVVDINEEKARKIAKKYHAKAYTNVDEILPNPEIIIADVMLPHKLHYGVVKKLLQAGKNVIVEKPIATTYLDAMDLIRLSKSRSVKFTVAENTKFVKLYRRVEGILKAGTIGNVWEVFTMIEGSEVARLSNRTSWTGRKENGGLIIDAGVHTFYLYKWLFGGVREVKSVIWNSLENQEVEDNAVMFGTLENGIRFVHRLSNTAQKPWTERIEVHGSKGAVLGDQSVKPPLRVYKGSGLVNIQGGYEEEIVEDVKYNPHEWKGDSMSAEVKDFVTCVIEGKTPQVDPVDAAYAVKVAEEARKNIILNLTSSLSAQDRVS